jgi:Fe-S cluster biogenesis protein NfuA
MKENIFMRDKVQAAIDKIRPALQKDVVKVQLTGACKGCPMSQMTLKEGIEKFVKSEIPEIVSVESV